ncbi:MAG: RNA methyltransferase [Bacteroidales bacterium]|nr:RNA methyltransferase [Bacteroidales bacterium]
MEITSAQNPKFRNLLLLQEKSKVRREQGLFVVEGRRELEHCLEAGFTVRTVFVCPEIAGLAGKDLATAAGRPSVFEIPENLYRKAAYRESTEGIIAEVEYRTLGLGDLPLKKNPLIVVLESVEKPGNLGAVLRSADAAGADAVIFCDPLTDLYNPNLIRASIGAVFTVPTVLASTRDTIAWLKEQGIRILTAQLQDSSLYYDTDMREGTAIVMGTESVGLSPAWREAADAHIRIPMLGNLDSLNVSVSAAILLFEAVRQRQGAV